MADDDQPLLALAKKTPVKVDDDAPLSALASNRKPVASPGGKVAKSPGNSKAAGKPTPKRKNGSSSSSSSSYSYTSSSESDGAKPRKGKAKAKAKTLKRTASIDPDAAGGEDGGDGGGAVKKRERSLKEQVCADLLCRWWYSEPYLGKDWPPQENEIYEEELAKRKLRRVTIQEWEWSPEEDDQGRKKVWELSQFRGCFRNSDGDMIDLRPKDTCPCLNNFMAKDMSTLCAMLESAYENQLKDLDNCLYQDAKLRDSLKVALTQTRHLAAQAAGLK